VSADLVAFLRARLDEDAIRATLREWHAADCEELPTPGSEYTYPCNCGVPERLAADVDAKRRILDLHKAMALNPDVHSDAWTALGDLLHLLALPYASHPDYRPEWAPTP